MRLSRIERLEIIVPTALALLVVLVSVAPSWGYKRPRSERARAEFRRIFPCPATGKIEKTCPGYIIDHRVPLYCGGPDEWWNMQWQELEESKIKDRWERKNCAIWKPQLELYEKAHP